jgi:hypothetical protein
MSKQKVIVKRHYLENYLKAKRVGVKLKGAVLARPCVQTPVQSKKKKMSSLGVQEELITSPRSFQRHSQCNSSLLFSWETCMLQLSIFADACAN